MCDPLSLTALALAGGGAGLNSVGAAKARNATSGVYNTEAGRQRALQQQALGDILSSSKDFTPENAAGTVDRSAQARTETLNKLPMMPKASGGDTPAVIRSEQGRANTEASAEAARSNAARARLGAHGDTALNRGFKISDLANRVGTNATMRNISQSAVPLELQAASEKGQGFRTAGDLLTIGSMLTGLYGASQALGGAAKAGATIPQTGVPSGTIQGLPYGGLPGGGPGGMIIV